MRITHRLQFIKLTALLGILLSALLSFNLWAGQRWFPKAPLFQNLPGFHAPYDYLHIGVLLVLIVFSLLSKHKAPMLLLVIFSVYLCMDDQNRLQPWFFNYNLILFVLLFFKNRVDEPNNYISVFISLQILVALIYIFSGIQKLNDLFVKDTYDWMIEPLGKFLSPGQMNLLHKAGYAAPYIETAIGISLLIKPLRFIAIPAALLMHLFILLTLGPTGNSYNYVVWPWNVMMVVLVLLLFANVEKERFFDISFLFKSFAFYVVITLMLVFPCFSLINKYDSYLSSSLYSGNTDQCTLVLSNKAYNRLPFYIKHFATPDDDYNILYIKHWCLKELKVPCVPEYRIYRNVQHYIIRLTYSSETDVKMVYTERKKILNL